MDSAHRDERNLAHSAAGRNVTNKADSVEIAKLKEDYEKQIQKLTFENRIKTLELENEMTKQDKEQKMKILQLEKDNQSLTHELELVKLKTAHEMEAKGGVVDREMEKEMLKQQKEFQNKLAEKDKKMAARENEFQNKLADKDKELVAKDKEIAAKENECKTKINEKEKATLAKEHEYQTKVAEMRNQIAAKENEFKLKVKDLEKEKELEIQALRHENEIMKSKKKSTNENATEEKKGQAITRNAQQNHLEPKMQSLVDGIVNFFSGQPHPFTSYKNWFEDIARSLVNKRPELVLHGSSSYYFVKKEMSRMHNLLFLATKRKNESRGEDAHILDLVVPNKQQLKNAKVFLLHPADRGMCIEHGKMYTRDNYEVWEFKNVTNAYYFGEKRSIIMLLKFEMTK
ncbi:putative protein tag-278 [Clytia hemisphaerica]|uniref:putative protein tag-278 n=1 Tax=Clytia hemisphaerica TaxID=252671 RepID=UPI0034D5E77F